MVASRGEVWWANLGPARGSAPAGRRPVVVVQADAFNRGALGTIVVAAITSNLHRADDPGNVRLSRAESGLSKDSVVNVTQLVATDRGALTARAGRIPPRLMSRVDEGLRLVLSL